MNSNPGTGGEKFQLHLDSNPFGKGDIITTGTKELVVLSKPKKCLIRKRSGNRYRVLRWMMNIWWILTLQYWENGYTYTVKLIEDGTGDK